jgi:hypothetical protein
MYLFRKIARYPSFLTITITPAPLLYHQDLAWQNTAPSDANNNALGMPVSTDLEQDRKLARECNEYGKDEVIYQFRRPHFP